jgi:hypothetical protein
MAGEETATMLLADPAAATDEAKRAVMMAYAAS